MKVIYIITLVLGMAGCLYAIINAAIDEIKKYIHSEFQKLHHVE